MSRIRIRHVTGFEYHGEVSSSYNEARMMPMSVEHQFVLFSHLDISPITSTHTYVDYWDTKVTSFEVLNPHERLLITASSLVEVGPRRSLVGQEGGMGWDDINDAVQRSVELAEQSTQSPLTKPAEGLKEVARSIKAQAVAPRDTALSILAAIHEEIEYEAGITGVRTTAAEAWDDRRGVCQDITHIALGALRAVGIPARYVSGYLHPRPTAAIGETVAGESHAWVEFWDGDWHGWDVTNNIDIGEGHVLVGRGRDYNDVPPFRGVYAGPITSDLTVKVDITREA